MVPLAHAQTFRVYEREGYRIVDIEASIVAWGGSSGGPAQRARLVLVPRDREVPELSGDLTSATLIRTPVTRIAVNEQAHEAILRALGIADRIVAVGGHTSYDDDLRARVRAGEVHQIGYGWHQPPTFDALLASRADVLLARMADLTHTQHLERVEALGIPVVPTFIYGEPHYMGSVEWILLVGMLTGRESEATALVGHITAEVERWKARAASQPRRSLLWAWYESAGDRWAVTQRNAAAALIRDANIELALSAPDDPTLDVFSRLSTEQLLRGGADADCWMIREPLTAPYPHPDLYGSFRAFREDCVFWQHGRKNPATEAWEIWEMGMVRPDYLLADLAKMIHPALRDGQYRYLATEGWDDEDVSSRVYE